MKLLRWFMRRHIKKLNKRADFCDYMVIMLREDIKKYEEEARICRYQAKNLLIP